MSHDIISLITSRKQGATKKEIFEIALLFGKEYKKFDWDRLHYAKSRGGSLDIYCEKKRWYSFSAYYYKGLVKFIHTNDVSKTDMGMAMGPVPYWITGNYELFKKTFPLSDFE